MPNAETITETVETSLDDHVETYIADNGFRGMERRMVREAITHGWTGAAAEVASELHTLIDEARDAVYRRRMPFDILARLDELVTKLEDGLGA